MQAGSAAQVLVAWAEPDGEPARQPQRGQARLPEFETVSLWVHLDADSGRPTPLPADFHEIYGGAAAGGPLVRPRRLP